MGIKLIRIHHIELRLDDLSGVIAKIEEITGTIRGSGNEAGSEPALRVNLQLAGRRSPESDGRPDFKAMDYILAFIFGFFVCAALVGTLWFLRERERARAFKLIREENDWLCARDRSHRRMIAYLREGIGEIRNILGGRGLLPPPARPIGQRLEDLAYSRGRHYATASRFFGGSHE